MTTRENFISAIVYLAGDELETFEDMLKLAKESEDQLINRLIGIAYYYKDELNK